MRAPELVVGREYISHFEAQRYSTISKQKSLKKRKFKEGKSKKKEKKSELGDSKGTHFVCHKSFRKRSTEGRLRKEKEKKGKKGKREKRKKKEKR